ncbi:MAG: hypothetical protein UT39_C0012G0042 [Candidatus Woesebacteria bacterium GW2011_GWA1_39_21]|uniref:Polymerase nucleotidyl transferase domain-containing protein n=1 Tax=Candidatus Woesebacteria bacterium GW2011_GWA1_39_21 TaxID=1618550 RepID=A0A0G0QKU0_9BACT|nr:MAG: hypothetical protein UT39_C0012G0042 [Candidatus Woesebacteria bacterium GW2011_GWA1_39_21]
MLYTSLTMSSHERFSNEIIERVVEIFSPLSDYILLEGSRAYGLPKPTSDIDIEVVTPEINGLEKVKGDNLLQPLISGLHDCLTISKESQGIDMLQIKSFLKDVPVGIDITVSRSFVDVVNTDLVNLDKDVYLLAIRNSGNFNPNQDYSQRTFDGRLVKFSKTYWLFSGREVTFFPAFLLTPNGSFVPGPLVDRYVCGTKILVDNKNNGEELLERLKDNITHRFLKEYSAETPVEVAAPFRCLSRWERIPAEMRVYLLEDGKNRINSLKRKSDL